MAVLTPHACGLAGALLLFWSSVACAGALPESGILSHETSTSQRTPEVLSPLFPGQAVPPAESPRVERLIEAMDVYSLSPHAARLAVPRMMTPEFALALRQGRASLPPPAAWSAIIRRAAQTYGLSEALVAAVIHTESSFQPDVVSPRGAQGLMQLMPDTRRDLERDLGPIDPFDPEANVMAGCAYLRRQFDRFSATELALAAYNAGPGAVLKYGGIPPFDETRAFVQRVLERAGMAR